MWLKIFFRLLSVEDKKQFICPMSVIENWLINLNGSNMKQVETVSQRFLILERRVLEQRVYESFFAQLRLW